MHRIFAIIFYLVLFPATSFGWSPTGHHVVGVLAYEMLSEQDRKATMEILSNVPDFEKQFQPPEGMTEAGSIERWQIGVAGAWPDMIRGTEFDRPTWHYQLGANYVYGDVSPPDLPGPLPATATMQTQELYIAQAVELCEKVFGDSSQPMSDRAIALCWMLHLYADGHQPCHAGSLYAPAFPDGDRGANFIKFKDGSNLHAAWDHLLGGDAVANDVRRRATELGDVRAEMSELHANSTAGDAWFQSSTWLRESVELAGTHVYTDEVTVPIFAASRGLTEGVQPYSLSKDYFRAAGKAARVRIKQAGYRVARAIQQGIASSE